MSRTVQESRTEPPPEGAFLTTGTASRTQPEASPPLGFGVTALTLAAAVALLYYGRVLWITFAFALFLALAMRPFVSLLERARVPRVLAILLLLFVLIGAVVLLVINVAGQINQFYTDYPRYQTRLKDVLTQVQEFVKNLQQKFIGILPEPSTSSPAREVKLQESPFATTRVFVTQLGQTLENCYGINRPDIAQMYSGYPNADNSGFNFTFFLLRNAGDPSGIIAIYLPTSDPNTQVLIGYTNTGAHSIAVRAGDVTETVTQFGAMSADILCDQTKGDQPAFGNIDSPTNYQYIDGTDFEIFGWAWDLQGVTTVQIDIDGQVVGNAQFGLFRPDVRKIDPRVPSDYSGFSFVLDTTMLSNSAHDIVVYVIDRNGNRTEIGRRKAVVNNNVSTHQRGVSNRVAQ